MFNFFIFLFTVASIQVNAASLSRLFQDPEVYNPNDYDLGYGKSQPVLINERILFAGRTTNGNALWALDVNTLEKIELLQGFGNNSKVEFIRMDDQVFFKFNTDYSSGEKIWQSDGTVAGTQLFYSDQKLDNFNTLKKVGSVFYTHTNDDELLVSDGSQVVIHPIDPLYNEGVCAFSIDKVVIYNYINGSPRYRYSNGSEVTELDFDLPESYFNYQSEVVAYNDSCYLIVPAEDSERGGVIWEIDENGQTSLVNIPTEIGNDVWQIIEHNDQLYATAFNVQNNVFLLNSDLSGVVASLENFHFPRMYSSGPYLALMYSPPTSPPTIGVNFVNGDLSETVGRLSSSGSSSTARPPIFHPVGNEWLMAQAFSLLNNSEIKSLVMSPFTANEKTLELPFSNNHKVITSEDSERVFIKSTARGGRSDLNELVTTPKINSLIDGSWIEPNTKNQGLMLRTGQRGDGSEYLVATIYTYNNGEPFWLAGNVDIALNMDSIEVPMFTYDGLGFFEPELDANQIPFGTLEMKLTSCQTMDMTLQTPLGTEIHTLYRIDDVSATQYCVD